MRIFSTQPLQKVKQGALLFTELRTLFFVIN